MEPEYSAFHDFRDKVREERSNVSSINSRSFSSSVSNTPDRVESSLGSHRRDESIPVEPLLTMKGTLLDKPVVVVKDDGCSTNLISQDFAHRNTENIQVYPDDFEIYHSKKETTETAGGKVIIKQHI